MEHRFPSDRGLRGGLRAQYCDGGSWRNSIFPIPDPVWQKGPAPCLHRPFPGADRGRDLSHPPPGGAELIKAFAIIGQSIPVAFREVVDWLAENLDEFPQTGQMLENLQNLNVDWNSLWDSVINYLKAGIGGFLNSTVTLVAAWWVRW